MRKLFALLLLAQLAFPAVQNTSLLRVLPSLGSSTNGGGFDSSVGSPGTDYSVNANKNAAGCTSCGSSTVDLSTTDGVANGSTTYTSATANFSTAVVGNAIYFSGGTGSIAAIRGIVTARASTTSIILSITIAASTGMTMNIGGGLDTIDTALTANSVGTLICVKSTATITRTANIVLNNNFSPTGGYNRLWGYTTTCGDHGPVNITLSTNAGLTAIQGTGVASGWWVDGFNIDCATLGTSTGVAFLQQSQLTHSKIANCTTRAFLASSLVNVFYNEFTGCTSACTDTVNLNGGTTTAKFNYIHDNVAHCVSGGNSLIFTDNIVANCTGALHDGINALDLSDVVERNSFYNIARDCVRFEGSSGHIMLGTSIQNNILSTCGQFGIDSVGTAQSAGPGYDGNAYFASGTANRHNVDNANFTSAYVNIWDIQLTADPFTNKAGGDYTLNSTAGGGAALKGVGQAGFVGPSWSKATGTGYMDMGTFQTQFGTGSASTNSAYVQ